MTLLEILIKVRDAVVYGDRIGTGGICHYVNVYSTNHDEFLVNRRQAAELIQKWPMRDPHHPDYPVPSGDGRSAKFAFSSTPNVHMWDTKTTYGANRVALLEFMIEELSK